MAKKLQNKTGAEIRIYGTIDSWGEGSSRRISTLITELAKKNDHITIRVNSGGGSVMEAVAIYNVLNSTDAFIHIIVEGIAASAMSFILMAADKVTMGKATQLMLHKMSGFVFGGSKKMRDTADFIDNWETEIYPLYAEKTGMTVDEIKDKFFQEGKDTWLTPKQALDFGLIDEVVEGVVKKSPSNSIAPSIDNYYQFYENQISNSVRNPTNKKQKMNKDQLQMIGLSENASDEQINAKLNELATNKVDMKAHNELKSQVETMKAESINNVVDNAIGAGKITASEKESWVKLATNDLDSAKAALSKLPARQKLPDFNGGKKVENRSDWTVVDFLEKDPVALEMLEQNEPEKYKKLIEAEYGN